MRDVANLLKNSEKFYCIWYFKLKVVNSIQPVSDIGGILILVNDSVAIDCLSLSD